MKEMFGGWRRFGICYHGRKVAGQLLRYQVFRQRIPIRVNFLVTKRCNLKCFYCYAQPGLNSPEIPEPTGAMLREMLDQIYACGCRWINILGGEPLLRNDLGEFVDYARQRGMFLEITTNGYLIPQRLSVLKKIDHVCISLDGDKAANDRNRGEGSFERIVEGIEYAVRQGLKVRVHATLCRRSMGQDSLEFLGRFCRQRKITFNYSENGLPGIARLDPDFRLSPEETLDFYRGYRELKRRGFPIVSSDLAVDYVSRWPLPQRTMITRQDLANLPAHSYYPCQLGRNQCFIDFTGGVYPCTKKWGEGENAYRVGFQKAWERLADLDCVACKELGTIEQSLILGLRPVAVINALRNFAR